MQQHTEPQTCGAGWVTTGGRRTLTCTQDPEPHFIHYDGGIGRSFVFTFRGVTHWRPSTWYARPITRAAVRAAVILIAAIAIYSLDLAPPAAVSIPLRAIAAIGGGLTARAMYLRVIRWWSL